jgi:hypothetical protein
MENKGWLASKTMWFNVLTLVVSGATWGAGALTAHPDFVCVLVIVQAVGNLILRRFTSVPIGKKES